MVLLLLWPLLTTGRFSASPRLSVVVVVVDVAAAAALRGVACPVVITSHHLSLLPPHPLSSPTEA